MSDDPADQRYFVISAEEFARLEAELGRPPKVLPGLAALLRVNDQRANGDAPISGGITVASYRAGTNEVEHVTHAHEWWDNDEGNGWKCHGCESTITKQERANGGAG